MCQQARLALPPPPSPYLPLSPSPPPLPPHPSPHPPPRRPSPLYRIGSIYLLGLSPPLKPLLLKQQGQHPHQAAQQTPGVYQQLLEVPKQPFKEVPQQPFKEIPQPVKIVQQNLPEVQLLSPTLEPHSLASILLAIIIVRFVCCTFPTRLSLDLLNPIRLNLNPINLVQRNPTSLSRRRSMESQGRSQCRRPRVRPGRLP